MAEAENLIHVVEKYYIEWTILETSYEVGGGTLDIDHHTI